ncbi:MAG: outer membrane protein assembly factor BamB [Chlamydiales bacterium]|jgi:outer membrane protein assembly factor BamB
MHSTLLALLLSLAAFSTPSDHELNPASDWSGWRGVGADGVAQGSPPLEFSEESNLKWKAELPGRGLSSPVIVGGRVFITAAVAIEGESSGDGGKRQERDQPPVDEVDFLVMAFDRADGSIAWEQVARTQVPHQGTHPDGSFAAPSVVSDGQHIFVSFGSYGIYAYDLAGELAWEVDLGDMDIQNGFGEGSSPVLCGSALVVQWDHTGDSFLVALDKATGKELWRTVRELGTNWSTPLVVERAQGAPLIIVSSSTTVAYDGGTGKVVWTCGPPVSTRPGGIIASPLLHAGVLIYGTGTRRGGTMVAVDLDSAKGENVYESDALMWTRDRDVPRIPSPIAHDGILYALKSTSGILSAFDVQSGEPLYEPTRLEAVSDVWASPVLADGRIYIAGRDGTIEVVATGAKFSTLAVNHLDAIFDATPAVAGDELFLRGRSELYCIAKTE